MDNITVVFVAFENFERCINGNATMLTQSFKHLDFKGHGYVVDEELMEEEVFPEK